MNASVDGDDASTRRSVTPADRSGRGAWDPPLWSVLVCAVVLVGVTVDVLLDGPLRQLDGSVASLMRATGVRDDPVGGTIGFVLSQTGGRATNLLWVLVLCVALAISQRTLGPLLRLVTGMALLTAVIYAGKTIIGRTAPAFAGGDVLHHPGAQSFPSGHQANAVLIAGIGAWIALEYIRTRWVRRLVTTYAVAAPVVAALAVLAMNYHWLTDIMAGTAVGVILLWVVHRIFAGPIGDWSALPARQHARSGHVDS